MRKTVSKRLRKTAFRQTGGAEGIFKGPEGQLRKVSFSGVYKAMKRTWRTLPESTRKVLAKQMRDEEKANA